MRGRQKLFDPMPALRQLSEGTHHAVSPLPELQPSFGRLLRPVRGSGGKGPPRDVDHLARLFHGAEKDGLEPADQWHPAGETPVTVTFMQEDK